jgi:DNA-directed RNA polymerase sigma subunit (sigma70/sigma32)
MSARQAPSGEDADRQAELHGEVRRGRLLDRDLARGLGRPEPERVDSTQAYVGSLDRSPVLAPATERALLARAKAGDPAAKADLVEAFMPLISSSARPYRSGQVGRQELLQEGVVGLLRALEGFDPGRDVPFWA